MPVLGIDVSNYTGEITPDDVRAMKHSLNIERAIIACQFPQTYKPFYKTLGDGGIACEAYIYLYNGQISYAQQVMQARAVIGNRDVFLWLDIEDRNNIPPDVVAQISAAIEASGSQTGIYTGAWYWPLIGNPDVGSNCALWTANWDGNPEGFEVDFGGWKEAKVKQYESGYRFRGINLNLDSWSD